VQITNNIPSREHSKWFTPVPISVPERAKVMDVDVVLPPAVTLFLLPSTAAVIEVVGCTVSMLQMNDAGDASLFPTLSEALISIV
jgi:hypothetical protein